MRVGAKRNGEKGDIGSFALFIRCAEVSRNECRRCNESLSGRNKIRQADVLNLHKTGLSQYSRTI